MGLDMDQQTWSPYDEATNAQKDAAALYVASVATGPADCRQLLDALGLLPKRLTVVHGLPGYRQGCKCRKCRKANADRNQRQRAKKASVPATTTADCPINTRGGAS